MVIVGAIIGGVTNLLAIKMLFRPYRAYYLGSWKIPFTPGLIPKRRAELAEQLGQLVVNHLLTVEGLQKKLENKLFINETTIWVQSEVTKHLHSKETLAAVLENWFGITNGNVKVEQKLAEWINKRMTDLLDKIRPLTIEDAIPDKLNEKVENYIPQFSSILIEKGKDYFKSPEGIASLSNMVDRFLMGKGSLGNMIAMFLGNERLVDKIQPEIIKMLNDQGTQQLIEVFLTKEWQKVKQLKVKDIEDRLQLSNIANYIQAKMMENIPLEYLDKPLQDWTPFIEQHLVTEVVPRMIAKIGQAISRELVYLLKKLQLEDIVKEQVEQFSVNRLEEMILSITSRELTQITYLGALLGGLIGLFQAFFVIFFS